MVVLVVAAGAAGTVAGQANTTTVDDPESVDTDYTLEELRQNGPTLDNAPPSVRVSGDRAYWAIHWPANALLADEGEASDDQWKYLEAGETVDRNTIYLRTINLEGAEEATIKVATYRTEERVTQDDNVNVTETVATDLHVQEVNAELERGWAMVPISLPQADETQQVTMWIEGVDEARWTFEHQSVATTQPANVDSEGDYLMRASMEFILPIIIGSFGVGAIGRKAIKKAGIGPQWGYLKWGITLTFVLGMVIWSAFSSIAEVLVAAPIIAAAVVVAIIGIVLIETYTTNVERALFYQPELVDAKSPSGERAVDMLFADGRIENVVKMPDGSVAVVRSGLLPFLSRCFGGAARLVNAEQIQTSVEMTNGPVDTVYFVHPDADRVLEYEPEGWSIELPEFSSWNDLVRPVGIGLVVLTGGSLVASTLGSLAGFVATSIALAGLVVRPQDGTAAVRPAPAHQRSVLASAMYLNIETQNADSLEAARSQIVKEQARAGKEVDAALQEKDATLVETMFETDVSSAIETLSDGLSDDRDDRDEPDDPEGSDA
ncbi:MAG: hypothetical protein ACOC8O_01340 [Natronomonas sp.]